MGNPTKGLSLKDFAKKFAPKRPRSEGKAWDKDTWHHKTELDEAIVNFICGNGMTSSDFIEHFNKNIKPEVDEILRKRDEEQKKARRKFEARKRIESLPENAIPAAFFGRRAYPKNFAEITKRYTLDDFKNLRTKVLNGKLDSKLGNYKTEFLTWLNSVINEHPEPNEPEKSNSLLKNLVSTFRGH